MQKKGESCFQKARRLLTARGPADVKAGHPPPHELGLILPGSSLTPAQPSCPPHPQSPAAAGDSVEAAAGDAPAEEGDVEGQQPMQQQEQQQQQKEQQPLQQQQQQQEQQQLQHHQQQTLGMALALQKWLKLGGKARSPRESPSCSLSKVKICGKG